MTGHADGDEKLTESLVVVEYLDAKYGGDTPIIPRDPAQLAKVSSKDQALQLPMHTAHAHLN